jgi:hypothetical protein
MTAVMSPSSPPSTRNRSGIGCTRSPATTSRCCCAGSGPPSPRRTVAIGGLWRPGSAPPSVTRSTKHQPPLSRDYYRSACSVAWRVLRAQPPIPNATDCRIWPEASGRSACSAEPSASSRRGRGAARRHRGSAIVSSAGRRPKCATVAYLTDGSRERRLALGPTACWDRRSSIKAAQAQMYNALYICGPGQKECP